MSKTKAAKRGHQKHAKHSAKKRSSKTRLRKLAIAKRRAMRPWHKRLALHPINILFLLCVGVLLTAMSTNAIADSFDITAAVDAPALASGAYITSPVNNSLLTTSPATIIGSCPSNSYVILLRNDETGGVAWCRHQTFTIETGLYPGSNVLQAQDYNITDNPGPSTPSITVSYVPPSSSITTGNLRPKNGVNQSTSLSSNNVPLLLTTSFTFKAVPVGSAFTTTLNLAGGVPPYQLTINWGDGSSQDITFNSDPTFNISHIYSKHGYFPISVAAVDSAGTRQYLQAAAFIRIPTATSFLTSPTSSKSSKPNVISRAITSSKDWLIVIWPSYLLILLMVFSFWLGEKEAYQRIRSRLRKNKKLKLSLRSR